MSSEFLSHVSFASPRALISVGVVFPALSLIAVTFRFYTRHVQKTSLLMDDWLTLPALILIFGMGVAVIVGVQGRALGYLTDFPTSDVEAQMTSVSTQYALAQKIFIISQLLQTLALAFIKLSVVFFYRRIFCTIQGGIFNNITKVVIGLIVAWSLAFFFALLFQCGTSWYALWSSIEDSISHCENGFMLVNGFAISDSISDLMILLLPIPRIWMLRITHGQKCAVIGVFLLGGIAFIASIMRMVIFIIADRAGFSNIVDPDVELAELLYWSLIESGLSLIAACLPTLHFLFRGISSDVIFGNIRSMLSLGSLRSRRSGWSQHRKHTRLDDQTNASASSGIQSSEVNSAGIEAFVMRDLEGQRDLEMRQGRIVVQTEISHCGNSF